MSKVWLISDSSHGLGRALAAAVLAAGDRLVAGAHEPELLRDLLDQYGDRMRAIALDVTDEASVYAAINVALRSFGRIDVVVSRTGHVAVDSIEDLTDMHLRAQFESNFFGIISLTQAALPILRQQGSGHFIHWSEFASGRGTPGLAAHQATKLAVQGFHEVLASEIEPFGLEVTLVETGAVGAEVKIRRLRAYDHAELHPEAVESADPAHALVLAAERVEPLPARMGSVVAFPLARVILQHSAEDVLHKPISSAGCATTKLADQRLLHFPVRPAAA
jgi:NAD(P)-dependent dehydrogenase (short-subunit alcohol dehydrogenase family)